jgi:signal transduction histidine kinase
MSWVPAMNRVLVARVLLPAGIAGIALLVAAAATHADPGAAIGLLTVFAFLAGRSPSRPTGIVVISLFLVAVAVSQVIRPNDDVLVPEVMLPLTLFLAGLALRTRDVMTERLAMQAADIEAERDAYVQLSVRYERARIAAELHDVVAHAISLMVVQAGAGQRLVATQPALADEALSVIATAARQAEEDLDRLASLLAQDVVGSDEDLQLVEEIVDRAGAAGLPVTLRLEGDSSGFRGVVAHTALRVVQEGLTNALRYAPGAPVNVHVLAGPAALDVNVANPAPSTTARLNLGSGHGLTGLRERVAACGGILEAGPDGSGGWSVHACLPR